MQIIKFLGVLLTMVFCDAALAQAPGGGHLGHGGGNGSGDLTCIKAKISHYKPEHLATVTPGSEFSFFVSGSNGPGHIHVTIREHPVELNLEDKETFYLVKGKLPLEYKNETIRINIKVKAKIKKCDEDGGLLLKVSE